MSHMTTSNAFLDIMFSYKTLFCSIMTGIVWNDNGCYYICLYCTFCENKMLGQNGKKDEFLEQKSTGWIGLISTLMFSS